MIGDFFSFASELVHHYKAAQKPFKDDVGLTQDHAKRITFIKSKHLEKGSYEWSGPVQK